MNHAEQLVLFAEDLAVLLNAGSDLDSALGLMVNSRSDTPLKLVLSQLRAEVRKGVMLSAALAQHEAYFDRYFVGMVRSGEASGRLSHALEQLAKQLESNQELKNQINTALIYPTILTFAMGVSLLLVIGIILPRLTTLFGSFGGELSFAAQGLLAVGEFINSWGKAMGIVLSLGVVALYLFQDPLQIKHRLLRALKHVPVLRHLFSQIEFARFTSTLSSLLGSGLTQVDALTIAAESFQDAHNRSQIDSAIAKIKEGTSLSVAMESVDGLGALYSHSLASGEQAGQLPKTLAILAQRLEKEFTRRAQRLASMVEPILIIVLGVVIGLIIITVFSALQTMGDLPI